MKRTTIAVLVASACLGAAFASAEKPMMDHKAAHHEAMEKNWKEKFGLTDDQASKLKAAMKSRAEAGAAARKQMKESMEKLKAQITLKSKDSDVQASLDQLEKARKDLRAAEDKFNADTASFLTPTQRGKMLSAMLDHFGHERTEHGPAGRPMLGHDHWQGHDTHGGPGDMPDKSEK